MRNIAIIPARGGSKRLPNKNLMLLGGIPLLAHSILFAKANLQFISEIYVSTDDPKIKACAIEYGAKVIDRPESISGDHEPTVSALRHVLENHILSFDNVILLQPTNPLRPANLMEKCMEMYIAAGTDSLFTVSKSHHKLGRIEAQKFIPYNYVPGQRGQDLEPLYFENGLLYISASTLIMNDKIISDNAVPFEITHPFGNVDIDSAEDFDYASYLFEKHKKFNESIY